MKLRTTIRGEEGEGSGEKGFQELIKDTWTKPRGSVEAREGGGFGWGRGMWGGGNADNCN